MVVGSGEQDIDPFCSPVLLWIKNWEKVGFIISELVVGSGEQDNIILFIHFGLLHVNPSIQSSIMGQKIRENLYVNPSKVVLVQNS